MAPAEWVINVQIYQGFVNLKDNLCSKSYKMVRRMLFVKLLPFLR